MGHRHVKKVIFSTDVNLSAPGEYPIFVEYNRKLYRFGMSSLSFDKGKTGKENVIRLKSHLVMNIRRLLKSGNT